MLTDLPNLLTLSRIAAIPLLVALVALRTPRADLAACIVFAAAAITDYFDGHLARTRRQSSDLGRMLDPIADKLLVGATLMMLAGEQPAGHHRAVSRRSSSCCARSWSAACANTWPASASACR